MLDTLLKYRKGRLESIVRGARRVSIRYDSLSNNCEHFALSVLYGVSSIVCLKKVLWDRNVA